MAQHIIPLWNEQEDPPAANNLFELVLVFEDTTTRNRAQSLYETLEERLEGECLLRARSWHLAEFSNASVLEKAVEAAAKARMIVIALRTGQTIPELLQRWIGGWLPERQPGAAALVTLVACTGLQTSVMPQPIQVQLEQLAREAGLDFFAQEFDAPDANLVRLIGDSDTEIVAKVRSDLSPPDKATKTQHGWGINE